MNREQFINEVRLTDEEIAYQIKYAFEHNEYMPIEILLEPIVDSACKAQLQKILNHPDIALIDMSQATNIDNEYLGKLWLIAQRNVIPLSEEGGK